MKKILLMYILGVSLCLPVQAQSTQRNLALEQQVQQAVSEQSFGDLSADWEIAYAADGHFKVRTRTMVCPAVLSTSSVLVTTTCFFPMQGPNMLPESNRLLQRVVFEPTAGGEQRFHPVFKQLKGGYVALSKRPDKDPQLETGTLCARWKNPNVSSCTGAVMEGGKVYVPANMFKSGNRKGDQLEQAYFSRENGEQKKLSLRFASDNLWSVLSVE